MTDIYVQVSPSDIISVSVDSGTNPAVVTSTASFVGAAGLEDLLNVAFTTANTALLYAEQAAANTAAAEQFISSGGNIGGSVTINGDLQTNNVVANNVTFKQELYGSNETFDGGTF
jgi:hypothetical protein